MPGLPDSIYERARLTGEFRLRSGATSNEYFDKYLFESDPAQCLGEPSLLLWGSQ